MLACITRRSNRLNLHDIALIRLSTPLLFSSKVAPVNLPPCDFDVEEDYKGKLTQIQTSKLQLLPQKSREIYAREMLFVSVTAFVAGWGQAFFNTTPPPHALQEVDVKLITWETCSKFYGFFNDSGVDDNGTAVHYNVSFAVTDTMLCAGHPEGGKDSCNRDSGGPLMLYNPDRDTYTQVGITSWGHGCAVPRQPEVYTKLSKYVNWIHSHVQTCRNRQVH